MKMLRLDSLDDFHRLKENRWGIREYESDAGREEGFLLKCSSPLRAGLKLKKRSYVQHCRLAALISSSSLVRLLFPTCCLAFASDPLQKEWRLTFSATASAMAGDITIDISPKLTTGPMRHARHPRLQVRLTSFKELESAPKCSDRADDDHPLTLNSRLGAGRTDFAIGRDCASHRVRLQAGLDRPSIGRDCQSRWQRCMRAKGRDTTRTRVSVLNPSLEIHVWFKKQTRGPTKQGGRGKGMRRGWRETRRPLNGRSGPQHRALFPGVGQNLDAWSTESWSSHGTFSPRLVRTLEHQLRFHPQ
jgi:hypothetical protein